MTGIVPISGTQQFDKNSSPPAFLVGGRLFVYLPTTTTPAPVFADFALTTPRTSPIILDTSGRIPAIYGAMGSVRLRLVASNGIVQFDEDNVALVAAAAAAGPSPPDTITADELWRTGDIKIRYDENTQAGFVRANGKTIGSPGSLASELAALEAHDLFTLLWFFPNISLVDGPRAALPETDWVNNRKLILPDMSGRLIGGRDDLGNGPQGRITGATVTGPLSVGAVGGLERATLDITKLPQHTHPGATVIASDKGHTHFLAAANIGSGLVGVADQVARQGSIASGEYSLASAGGGTASVGLSGNSAVGSMTFTTTVDNAGVVGPVLNTISPVMLFTVYIKL